MPDSGQSSPYLTYGCTGCLLIPLSEQRGRSDLEFGIIDVDANLVNTKPSITADALICGPDGPIVNK